MNGPAVDEGRCGTRHSSHLHGASFVENLLLLLENGITKVNKQTNLAHDLVNCEGFAGSGRACQEDGLAFLDALDGKKLLGVELDSLH